MRNIVRKRLLWFVLFMVPLVGQFVTWLVNGTVMPFVATGFTAASTIFAAFYLFPRLFDAWRQSKIYRIRFGLNPPKNYEERRVQSARVLAELKRAVETFTDACSYEQTVRAEPPSTEVKVVEDHQMRLNRAKRSVCFWKRNLRLAQNSAQFFAYKVPNNAVDILKCNRLN